MLAIEPSSGALVNDSAAAEAKHCLRNFGVVCEPVGPISDRQSE
jgi:hypothetical protein